MYRLHRYVNEELAGLRSKVSAAKDTITLLDRVIIPKLSALGPYLKHLQVLVSKKLMLNNRLTHIIVEFNTPQGLGKTALEQQEKNTQQQHMGKSHKCCTAQQQASNTKALGAQQVNSKQQTDSQAT